MSELVERLKSGKPVIAAELRPPRAELATAASMDAWIDTYHAVRGLTRAGTFVFLTDSAVGMKEEDNLRHLVINLGSDVPRSHVVPFLTCKHTIGVLPGLRGSGAPQRVRVARHSRRRQARRAGRDASSTPGSCAR